MRGFSWKRLPSILKEYDHSRLTAREFRLMLDRVEASSPVAKDDYVLIIDPIDKKIIHGGLVEWSFTTGLPTGNWLIGGRDGDMPLNIMAHHPTRQLLIHDYRWHYGLKWERSDDCFVAILRYPLGLNDEELEFDDAEIAL